MDEQIFEDELYIPDLTGVETLEQIYCSYYCKDKEGKECTWKMVSCDVTCFYSPIEELKKDGMFCEFWDGSEE